MMISGSVLVGFGRGLLISFTPHKPQRSFPDPKWTTLSVRSRKFTQGFGKASVSQDMAVRLSWVYPQYQGGCG